jgi:tetratricopeptide (TPR) repeat protein
MFLKHFEQALEELTHANQLSKPSAIILSNMAFAQISLQRYNEGLASARAALRVDSSCAQAHYLAGLLLVHDRRTLAEGIQHLETASRTMPVAQAELDRLRRESALTVTRPDSVAALQTCH